MPLGWSNYPILSYGRTRIVTEGFRVIRTVVDIEKVLKEKRKLGVAPGASDYKEFTFVLVSERRIWEAKELGEVIFGGIFPMRNATYHPFVLSKLM
jgi:hypothetical protein